jgi:hypothetical protein
MLFQSGGLGDFFRWHPFGLQGFLTVSANTLALGATASNVLSSGALLSRSRL